jgi:hypothetical protein
MLFDGVSKRVEMSMSLTAANEIVSWLSKDNNIDAWTLSKMAVLFTVVLVTIDTVWTSQKSKELYEEREGIVKLLAITRQISILGVARLVLALCPSVTVTDAVTRQDTSQLGSGTHSFQCQYLSLWRSISTHFMARI